MGIDIWIHYWHVFILLDWEETCQCSNTFGYAYDLLQLNFLLYWDRVKMAPISQPTFLNAFSWMKMYEFLFKFHWGLFLRVRITIFQYWFRQWLDVDQAISHYLNQWWYVYWRIYASLGLNELKQMSDTWVKATVFLLWEFIYWYDGVFILNRPTGLWQRIHRYYMHSGGFIYQKVNDEQSCYAESAQRNDTTALKSFVVSLDSTSQWLMTCSRKSVYVNPSIFVR